MAATPDLNQLFVPRAEKLAPEGLTIARSLDSYAECVDRFWRDVDATYDERNERAFDDLLDKLDNLAIFEPLAFIRDRAQRAMNGQESRWGPVSYDELEKNLAYLRFTSLGDRP